jgi:hypothetical protein
MTIPFFLDSTQVPFNYTEIYGITDVETGGVGIITTFRAQAVTGLGWTEPSTALFKTPVDAAGRWFDVLLTRISATVLEYRMRNSSGTTITTRRIQITAGFAVRFFTNTMGFLIEAIQADPASSETLQGHMLDQSPNLQSDVSNYVIMAGRRNNTSVDDGSGNIVGHYAAIDNGTPAFVAGRLPSTLNAASGAIALQNIQSSFLLRDFLIHINQAGTIRWSGRICHALEIDSTIPPGSDRAVKIDTSTTATYRVTGNPLIQTARMCMRKS